MEKPVQLNPDEESFLKQLLLMTGREDRSAAVDESQVSGLKAIWPLLKHSFEKELDREARCDLVNRVLLTWGIKPISYGFYDVVLKDVDFSRAEGLAENVRKFRILCMLECGNFRFGYRTFNQGVDNLKTKWDLYFPCKDEADQRADRIRKRPGPAGLKEIDSSQLFALGYLAVEQAPTINRARKQLLAVIGEAIQTDVKDWKGLEAVARNKDISDLSKLVAECGIPGTRALSSPGSQPYQEVLGSVEKKCKEVNESAIEEARNEGLQNANTYLALHDVDVYVATSMRDPLHFTTNWALVQGVFHGELRDWHVRYFDPTQAYLPDRIQKGLMECLMIHRAVVTIYNAQESDTFGKDAELGVTLAERKPVIVYVARLFETDEKISKIYAPIDRTVRLPREELIADLITEDIIDQADQEMLAAPEKSKADVLAYVVTRNMLPILNQKEKSELALELIGQGYSLPKDTRKLEEYCVDRIVNLERRALIFREIHPLALQTSPFDGVARGVIVTRNIEETSRVLSRVLCNTLEYQIVEDENNWLLLDSITRSPVRVVTKNPMLTTAFWSEPWGR